MAGREGMKILLITTMSAHHLVREVVKEADLRGHEVHVFVSSAQVAPLATVESIIEEIRSRGVDLSGYDLVIFPGLIRGSASAFTEAFGVRAIKGTKFIGDLPELIAVLDEGVSLSTEEPADEIIRRHRVVDYERRLEEVVKGKKPVFRLGETPIYLRPPPAVLIYEYMIRVEGDPSLLAERLRKYGYGGVVVGCEAECREIGVLEVLAAVESFRNAGLFVGVDIPFNYSSLRDVLMEADLVMNVSGDDLDSIGGLIPSGAGVVLIPKSVWDTEAVLGSLMYGVRKAEELGITKVIIDPLVRPPMLGLSESIEVFRKAGNEFKNPLMFGLSNVYELIDADSPGVIALLTTLAFEVGASILLVTQSSNKARGALKEASIARDLAAYAYLRRSPPISSGVDLLILKDKSDKTVPPPELASVESVRVEALIPIRMDEKYFLKIYVDRVRKDIVVDVADASSGRILKRFRGRDPLPLGRAVLREYPLSRDHAMYLGSELLKASIALKLGKTYIQDAELFSFTYE